MVKEIVSTIASFQSIESNKEVAKVLKVDKRLEGCRKMTNVGHIKVHFLGGCRRANRLDFFLNILLIL